MKKNNYLKYILIVYIGILFTISLTSHPSDMLNLPGFLDINVLYHFSAYLILGTLAALNFKSSQDKLTQKRFILLAITFSLIIASIDELLQLFVPDRIPDIIDIVYDFLGILTSQLIFYKVKK